MHTLCHVQYGFVLLKATFFFFLSECVCAFRGDASVLWLEKKKKEKEDLE